jgi:hypothetical protein
MYEGIQYDDRKFYDEFTAAQLRDFLHGRGLKDSGTRAEMVARMDKAVRLWKRMSPNLLIKINGGPFKDQISRVVSVERPESPHILPDNEVWTCIRGLEEYENTPDYLPTMIFEAEFISATDEFVDLRVRYYADSLMSRQTSRKVRDGRLRTRERGALSIRYLRRSPPIDRPHPRGHARLGSGQYPFDSRFYEQRRELNAWDLDEIDPDDYYYNEPEDFTVNLRFPIEDLTTESQNLAGKLAGSMNDPVAQTRIRERYGMLKQVRCDTRSLVRGRARMLFRRFAEPIVTVSVSVCMEALPTSCAKVYEQKKIRWDQISLVEPVGGRTRGFNPCSVCVRRSKELPRVRVRSKHGQRRIRA